MANFFKSLFKGKEENENENENEKDKNQKKNFEIFKYDGLRAYRMGRTDYAVKCFLSALDIEEDFETMSHLSQIYMQTHELDKAREVLQRMAEMEPHVIVTHLTLSNLYYMQEAYEEMASTAQQAIDVEDTNAMAYYLLAKANHGLKDPFKAIAHLTKAITLKEDFIEALLLRAEVLTQMQQYPEAMADVEATLQLHNEEEAALLLRGKLKEATGRTEEAEEDYRTVTELNPFNEQAYICLGQLYIALKKLPEAIELFDEAIELNPHSAAAFHERGKAKLLNGDKDGASEDMKTALQLSPKENESLNGQFNYLPGKSDNVLGL